MLHRSTQLALALFLSLLATGCKVALTVTAGGDVTSLSGNRDCAGGSLCEYEVTDTSFIETFTAVPRAGYVFSKWQGGDDYLCAESTNPTCTISTNILETFEGPAREVVDTIIASGRYFYVQPLFTFVGIDTDEDGIKDYIDPDDDNDGVLDADDNCPLEGPNLDGFGCAAKKVFVTSESYTGNLGGLPGADQKCNDLAAAAGLSGDFKAWLSASGNSPNARFTLSTVPYQLVDGTVIADDYYAIETGLRHTISLHEDGAHEDGSVSAVWTNTYSNGEDANGGENPDQCGSGPGWSVGPPTLQTPLPLFGDVGRIPDISRWSFSGNLLCSESARLYCFEQ